MLVFSRTVLFRMLVKVAAIQRCRFFMLIFALLSVYVNIFYPCLFNVSVLLGMAADFSIIQ